MAGVALENWVEQIRDPKIECMSRDEMSALQSERLVKQVKNVYDHVEFYRKKMDDLGVEPGDIKGIEDISKLPFTTKEDLRDHYPFGLLAVPQEQIVRVQGTSGTTGKLTLASYTQKDVDVWGDEFKVEEVITNYLSNAINHCEGEKKICIFYTRKPDLLRVSVFNTGKPIPEEDIGQIWDKFYKVDKARTREYGGSGIGLSIVKAIMDSFHQECGVINHENGVEFWMELSTK